MEVGKGGKVTAQQEVQERHGFPVASIVSMPEVVEALDGTVIKSPRSSGPPSTSTTPSTA